MVGSKHNISKYLIAACVGIILLFSLAPVYSTFVVSFSNASDGNLSQILLPESFSLKNYILAKDFVLRPMLNSFSYAIISVCITLCISIPSAYVISRFKFRGRQLLRFILLFTQMLAGIVLMPAVYRIFTKLNLINSVPTLIFIYVGVSLPLSVWVLSGFLDGVPVSVEEAAIVDGANIFQVICQIVIPVIKPGITVSAIFTFVGIYNEFVIPLFLINNAKYNTITMTLNSFMTAITVEWQLLAAGAVIGMLPPLLIFMVFQKYIIGGAMDGAIKG